MLHKLLQCSWVVAIFQYAIACISSCVNVLLRCSTIDTTHAYKYGRLHTRPECTSHVCTRSA